MLSVPDGDQCNHTQCKMQAHSLVQGGHHRDALVTWPCKTLGELLATKGHERGRAHSGQ